MSTEENRTLLSRVFEELINKRNLSVLDDFFHPDCHIYVRGIRPQGIKGAKQLLVMLRLFYRGLFVTVEDMRSERDSGLARITVQGTRLPRKQITWTGWVSYRIADGKITKLHFRKAR